MLVGGWVGILAPCMQELRSWSLLSFLPMPQDRCLMMKLPLVDVSSAQVSMQKLRRIEAYRNEVSSVKGCVNAWAAAWAF